MMKCWVNEIKLWNFTLNLIEKLYKPIFAKRIGPNYFQNSQMVWRMPYNYEKICEKTLSELFRHKYIRKSYCLIQFTRLKRPLKFWESCRHSQRHTNCFLFCWTVIEYFAKTKNRPEAPWDRIASVIWHCYVLSMLMWTEQMLKKWLMSFHQKEFKWFILNFVKNVN